MATLKCRSARQDDLESLVALLANDPLGQARENASLPLIDPYRTAFAAIHEDPNNDLLVFELDGTLVGTLQLTLIPYLTHQGSWRGLIEAVRVHPEYRGQGLGQQMLRQAIQLANARGCRLIQLTSDKQRSDAIRFYEGLGFKATHEGFKMAL